MNTSLDNTLQPQIDSAQILIQLLLGSGMVSREELEDFKNIARDLRLPLIQVMTNSGSLRKEHLQTSGDALNRVQSKQISLDLAIRALRISIQKNCALIEAIKSAQVLHKTTKVVLSASNELTSLLLDAEIISREQLGRLLVRTHESSMMIGQVLVSDNTLTVEELLAALQTIVMIRAGLVRSEGVRALKYAYKEKMTIEQAQFELEMFASPDAKILQKAELFLMAKVMTMQDFVECLEIELLKQKDQNQILQERGFATAQQVECASQLLSYVANGAITPNEAATALSSIFTLNMTVYEAVVEVREERDDVNVRLGDLLVDASICTREEIETAMLQRPDSATKVGNKLLKSGIVEESLLFGALRLQTSLRLGYLSRDTAVAILRYCALMQSTVDRSLKDNNVFVPCRIQWLWV